MAAGRRRARGAGEWTGPNSAQPEVALKKSVQLSQKNAQKTTVVSGKIPNDKGEQANREDNSTHNLELCARKLANL
jgi:hypothetical protein